MTDKIKMNWAEDEEPENENVDATKQRGTKGKLKPDSRENSSNRKRTKYNSTSDTDGKKPNRTPRKPLELETDISILQRRQKQIDYGKNTVGYHNYILHVPLDTRTKEDPRTPDKYTKYSRRSWDTLIKLWRKKLHKYDTNGSEQSDDVEVEIVSDEDL